MEPGASDVLTQAGTWSPRSTAFFASNPAAIITDGFEVFVQLVIAAMTTDPPASFSVWLLIAISALFFAADPKASLKFFLTAESSTRSCGRFGPAIDVVTVAR